MVKNVEVNVNNILHKKHTYYLELKTPPSTDCGRCCKMKSRSLHDSLQDSQERNTDHIHNMLINCFISHKTADPRTRIYLSSKKMNLKHTRIIYVCI